MYQQLNLKHTCPVCNTSKTVNSENFYLYSNGLFVSLKCKPCYRTWRKDLQHMKKTPELKIKKTVEKLLSSHSPSYKNYEETKQIFKKLGFKYLGNGASRLAFEKYGLVVKIEFNGAWNGDLTQTDLEVENYRKLQKYSEDIRKHFVKILAHGKDYIITEKADIFVSYEANEKLCMKLEKAGINPRDVRGENTGYVNGTLKVIDFALCNIPELV